MSIQDKPDRESKAKYLSNMSDVACPFPTLMDLPRGEQWFRILEVLEGHGMTVIETKELEKIKHWASID